MIEYYPDKNSLKEVLTNEIPASRLKEFCKKKGVILTVNDKSSVAKIMHLIFWGYDDINHISQMMDNEKNYKKSIRFKVNSKGVETSKAMSVFIDTVKKMKQESSDQDVKVLDIRNLESDGNTKEITIEYNKKQKGKVKLLDVRSKNITITVSQKDGQLIADASHEHSSEIKVVQKFIDEVANNSKTMELKIGTVSLDNLSVANKISLFDKIFNYDFKNWSFQGIKSIKVNKDVSLMVASDNDDTDDNDDEIIEDEENILEGINTALLQGTGLRTNKFVQECVTRGYFFTQASIKLTHKTEALGIILDVMFKGKPNLLELYISSSFQIEDGKEIKSPLLITEQKQYLAEFQDIVFKLYSGILEETRKKAEEIIKTISKKS